MSNISKKNLLIFLILLLGCLNLNSYLNGDLEGYVYDQTGIPLTDAYVRVLELNQWTLTDFTGHYQFENLPVGDYSVVYDHAKLGAAITNHIKVKPLDITFSDGNIHYYDTKDFPVEPYITPKPRKKVKFVSSTSKTNESFEIKREKKNVRHPVNLKGSISGQVRDPLGEPVRFASINIVELGVEVEADYSGNYYMDDLDAGIYTVIFSKEEYENRRFIGVLIKQARGVIKNVTLRKL